MTAISFKADDALRNHLMSLAQNAGINLSAYIKLLLTKSIKDELSRVTENGLTVAEELDLLLRDEEGETIGPFQSVKELRKSLER